MLKVFYDVLRDDLRVMSRNRQQWTHPLFFFIILNTLFGIGVGFHSEKLVQISPVVIWVTFLLISLFNIEALFRQEAEEGILEQWVLSAYPLWWLLLAKSTAFWLTSCLPLILIAPLIGMALHLSFPEIMVLCLTLLVGSPALVFVGVIGAALMIILPRSGVFLGLLLLPLYVPILILGESSVLLLLSSHFPVFQIALLSGISVLAMTLAPHAAAGAIQVAMGE